MCPETRQEIDLLTTLEKVQRLRNVMRAEATNGDPDDDEYRYLRRTLIQDEEVRDDLPSCVKTCSDLPQFWSFIKHEFSKYKERRAFLHDEFQPLIARLEGLEAPGAPHDADVSTLMEEVDAQRVTLAWRKALQRRHEDPAAALTSARTLLEAVCKHILDESHVYYDHDADLPELYSTTSKQLNLAPSQHQEQLFKQILGSCHQIVQGLGAIRNKLSDSHGRSGRAPSPSARHAALGVNLAGTAAEFLLASWQDQKRSIEVTVDLFDD